MPKPNTIQWTATVTQEALKDIVKEHFTREGHEVQSVIFQVTEEDRGHTKIVNAVAIVNNAPVAERYGMPDEVRK